MNICLCCSEGLHFPYYVNTPIKEYNNFFQMQKKRQFSVQNLGKFLIFAQNIDCGYALESMRWF